MKATAVSNGRSTTTGTGRSLDGLTRDDLLQAYRLMLLSRRIDDKEIQLKNQSLIFFQISGAGHEAILAAAGMVLKPGYDWFYPYYRDRALCLALGVTAYEMFLAAVGAESDPSSGGRQMPSHWGHRHLNIVSGSSPTGTQCLHAIGSAEAGGLYDRITAIDGREALFHRDEVVYVSIGEGATSEGEFWESLNAACLGSLPVVYVVEDNGYAISVPVEVQTAGGDLSRLVASFPGLFVQSIDGTDFVASHRAMTAAAAYARARKGPALVHARVTRPYSHSLSDDERLYKTADERAAEALRDPLPRLATLLTEEGFATAADLASLAQEVQAEINDAADRAIAADKPRPDTVQRYVYSADVDPTSDAFAAEPASEGGKPETMVAAINRTLKDEMAREPAHRRLRRGRRRCQPRGRSGDGVRQGRGLQGHARPAAGARRDAGLQLAARRSRHRRPRHRHGDPRDQAGRRDPVLRLHLAGDDADPRRAVDDALSLEQRVRLPDGHPDRDWRLPARRRAVPQPVRREHLRALPGHPGGLSVERPRRRRPAAHRHPLRGPGAVPRAQAPLPADLQQGGVPGPGLSRSRLADRRSAATAPTWWSSPGAPWCSARCSPRSRRRRTASASW